MHPFPSVEELRDLIQLAKREDLGTVGDDVTSRLLVDENAVGVGTLLQKTVGITCGLPIVEMICRAYDERLRVEQIPGFHMDVIEGRFSDARTTPLLRIRGPLRSILSAERVILNFLQRMSGVATLTQLSAFLGKIVSQSRSEDPKRLIEIEVDTLEQLREVLKVEGVDVILLDNMDCPKMQQAVELRDRSGKKGKVDLEASGGVTLE